MEPASSVQKLLIIGNAGAGKTSIKTIMFDFSIEEIMFMGKYALKIWDCGGGDSRSMYKYCRTFSEVGILLYVFNVESYNTNVNYYFEEYYRNCLQSVGTFSKGAYVFAFLHKMDTVTEGDRGKVFQQFKEIILKISQMENVKATGIYSTTIWDGSLYQAWCNIAQNLTSKISHLKDTIAWLCCTCEYDEVALFDKSSLALLATHEINSVKTQDKHERISCIIKQMQLSCKKKKTQLNYLCINNQDYSVFISDFLPNTILLAVSSTPKLVEPHIFELGLKKAKQYFQNKCNNESMDDAMMAKLIDKDRKVK